MRCLPFRGCSMPCSPRCPLWTSRTCRASARRIRSPADPGRGSLPLARKRSTSLTTGAGRSHHVRCRYRCVFGTACPRATRRRCHPGSRPVLPIPARTTPAAWPAVLVRCTPRCRTSPASASPLAGHRTRHDPRQHPASNRAFHRTEPSGPRRGALPRASGTGVRRAPTTHQTRVAACPVRPPDPLPDRGTREEIQCTPGYGVVCRPRSSPVVC